MKCKIIQETLYASARIITGGNVLGKGTKLPSLEFVVLVAVRIRLAAKVVHGGGFTHKLAREENLLAANGRHHRGILCPRRQFLCNTVRLRPCIDLQSQRGFELECFCSARKVATRPHAARLSLQTQSAVCRTRGRFLQLHGAVGTDVHKFLLSGRSARVHPQAGPVLADLL